MIMANSKKIFFFDAKPYDQEFFDQTNRQFGYAIKYFNGHLNHDTAHLAAGHDVVCGFVNDVIDQATIAQLKREGIKLIALRSAGYNNVDLKAAYNNLHVVCVPVYSPYAVAEHAVALMLSLNRKIHKAYSRTRDGNFSLNGLLGFDMHGKTAGIFGTGRIGRCLIDILKGFGMNILAFDKKPDETYAREKGIRFVSQDEIFRHSDIISLNCPLTPETQYIINVESIAKMKDGVMIINAGRGKLIKTEALINGLKSRKIGAAGLDVYEEESGYFFEDFSSYMINDDVLARLLTFPNVLITSHQGFFTREAMTNIAQTTMENIREYFTGGYLKNEVCYRCGGDCKKNHKQRCF